MSTRTETLANNYVWKNEYSEEYKKGYNNIDWTQPTKRQAEWEEIKTDSGKTIYRLKEKG